MRKIYLIVLINFLIISCGVNKNSETKIFRYIELNKQYGKIYLNAKKENISDLIYLENGKYFLKNKAFGRVRYIQLSFNSDNLLKKMTFSYNSDSKLDLKIKNYQKSLGKPIVKNIKKAVWNDGETKFSIFSKNNKIYSELKDL